MIALFFREKRKKSTENFITEMNGVPVRDSKGVWKTRLCLIAV